MKKRILVTILIFSFIASSCNRNDINDKSKRNQFWVWWVDASTNKGQWIHVGKNQTVKNGKYTKFYYNGLIFDKGKFKDGKESDTTFYFDYAGKIFAYRIKDSADPYYLSDGYTKVFGMDGKIEGEGFIENHKFGGKWTTYYKSGFPSDITNYVHDTGWDIKYYDNQKMSDSLYVMGNNQLSIKHWFENGQIAHSAGLKNNQYDGEYVDYYENGQPKQKGYFKNGKLNGQALTWYSSGKLHEIITYVNSEKTGKWIVYYENGQMQADTYLVDGKFDGEQKIYDEKGKLLKDTVIEGSEK